MLSRREIARLHPSPRTTITVEFDGRDYVITRLDTASGEDPAVRERRVGNKAQAMALAEAMALIAQAAENGGGRGTFP